MIIVFDLEPNMYCDTILSKKPRVLGYRGDIQLVGACVNSPSQIIICDKEAGLFFTPGELEEVSLYGEKVYEVLTWKLFCV